MFDDDVWGSESIEEEGGHRQASHGTSELDYEWRARQNQFHTLGYRDGVEEGKNSSVQEGFNIGYAEATVAGFNWGVARGLSSAFATLPASVKDKLVGESEARRRLEALNSSIHSYSSTDALRSFYRYLNRNQEVRLSGSDAVLESHSIQEVRRLDLESQDKGPLDSQNGAGPVSMVGIDRLPESHSAGLWEPEYRDETEQSTVLYQTAVDANGRSIEAASRHENAQLGESSGEDNPTSVLPLANRSIEVSKELGHSEDGNSSFLTAPAAGKSELDELEEKVRSELELASIKICDLLIRV